MTKEEAVKELLRLLPHLMGEDVVIVSRETFDGIKVDFHDLASRASSYESTVQSASYAVSELQDQVGHLESLIEELQDIGDLETEIRSTHKQLEEL
jgi:TolA-binding protein